MVIEGCDAEVSQDEMRVGFAGVVFRLDEYVVGFYIAVDDAAPVVGGSIWVCSAAIVAVVWLGGVRVSESFLQRGLLGGASIEGLGSR